VLQIEQQEIGNATALVKLSGRLMLGPEGAQLEVVIRELLAKGVRRFIFDMSALSHIDSTGIGRCIASLSMITQAGGKLTLAGATGQVRDGFRITQLDRVFRFFDDVPAATAALG
jgi:anti-anti-sigma factor